MNIAFVNATKKWGGVKTWCLDMAMALREQGHATYIFGRRGAFVDKAAGLGVPARAVSFGFDFNPLLIVYFLYFFLTRRVDVVVVNIAKDLRTAGVAGRLLGLQVVQHVGSAEDFDDTPMVRAMQRLVRPRLLCCSEFVRNGILGHVPILAGYEIFALHPGVRVPTEPNVEAHTPPVIVATSQLNNDKRHAELLEALAQLKNEGLDFRLVVAGTGEFATLLRDMAVELGLEGRVEWAGFTSDIPQLLRGGDIFVLPTLQEPLGIALQEAMAAGLAPVARGGGGVPEIWPEACREYLTPKLPGSEVLAVALRKLLGLTNPEREILRRAAWQYARDNFLLQDQAARFAQWMAQPSKPS